ncbi:ABC transporter permease [Sanguibacter antarcticus]|uniref:ABC-2 family transporter n=1 Tax=Sanguibacter antarcticus TaxID=372484 RepID=A0A2A9E2Z5_9MICO|nr:ABC transporter permease [Sanguibacter antarcticus]PFG32592.1 ABC-2 family transporter [Sanguibacter antarcticus]
MNALLRSEYRKLVTTRLWWILLLATAVYMAFLGGMLALTLTISPDGSGAQDAPTAITPETVRSSVYGVAAAFGYVFPVIVGALSITGEYRHNTITPTFLAEPDRLKVLVAKLLLGAGVGALFGAVATLCTVGAGAGVLAATGHPTLLGDPDTWTLVGRSVLALTVWGVLGVGLGSLITNQVAAIVVVLVYTQFLEPVVRLLLTTAGDLGSTVVAYLPGAAGEAITGGSVYSAMGMGNLLPWVGGLALLALYALVLAAVGAATSLRKDAG